MNKKSWKTETWVGVFLLIGILMMVGAVLSIGDFTSSKDKTYVIDIQFKNSSGLIKGSQLKMRGATIGAVTSEAELTNSGDGVVLQARIDNNIRIPKNSKFHIEMQGVLGGNFIDVVPPAKLGDEYIEPNELLTGEAETDLTKIKNNAMTATEEIVSLLRKIDKNSNYIEQAVKDISTASRNLSEMANKLNNGVLSDQNLGHLASIMNHMDRASAEAPELLKDARSAVLDIREATKKASLVLANAEDKINKLNPVFDEVPFIVSSWRKTSDNVSSVVDDVKKGKGTMGMMLYDKKFRNNFDDFVRNLRDYGILRYRDPKEPPPSIDPRTGYSGSRR